MKFELAEIIVLVGLGLFIVYKIGDLGAGLGRAASAADDSINRNTGSTLREWFGDGVDPSMTPEQQKAADYVTGYSFWDAVTTSWGF